MIRDTIMRGDACIRRRGEGLHLFQGRVVSVMGMLASSLVLAVCMEPSSVRCTSGNQEWYCPADLECQDYHHCVTRVQMDQCIGKKELAPCEIPGVPQGSMRCRHKACVIPYCGDEVIDDNEQCDGSQLDGESCATMGFEFGTLSCTDDCTFDLSICRGFVHVPPPETSLPVTFSMGSPASEPCRDFDEKQHPVTLTHSFEISAYEVTQEEFESLMGYNPSYFPSCGPDCPVENVSWHEAVMYCNVLSAQKGLAPCYSCTGNGSSATCTEALKYSKENIYNCPGYRLPTDAEWEYAYRAGSSTTFYPSAGNNGSLANCTGSDPNADKISWYSSNSAVTYAGCLDLSSAGGEACSGPHSVGLKAPNDWGLYDMAGNVWEWSHDWYRSDYENLTPTDPCGDGPDIFRVLRSGPFDYSPSFLRAAYRLFYNPSRRIYNLGFRPCRTNH